MKDLLPLFDQKCPVILAGPCSAESEAQTLETASQLSAQGIKIFRAGVWKPRTHPGGFEGVGTQALAWLKEVKQSTGMMTATEVATPAHLEKAVEAGIDGVWIGARTSANPFAVQELADALAALEPSVRNNLTVLVKNPVSPDLELWIGAIQRIYEADVRRLGAIHRGFSMYGENRYRNTPLWRIPFELRRRLPNLPILCDPSHIAGQRELVEPVARQAMEMCYDGLIIESHCEPESAVTDSAQQLTPPALGQLIRAIPGKNIGHSGDELSTLRSEIDALDTELLDVLSRRMNVVRRIGDLKRRKGIAVVQPERYSKMVQERTAAAVDRGLDPDFVQGILAAIHEESVKNQL